MVERRKHVRSGESSLRYLPLEYARGSRQRFASFVLQYCEPFKDNLPRAYTKLIIRFSFPHCFCRSSPCLFPHHIGPHPLPHWHPRGLTTLSYHHPTRRPPWPRTLNQGWCSPNTSFLHPHQAPEMSQQTVHPEYLCFPPTSRRLFRNHISQRHTDPPSRWRLSGKNPIGRTTATPSPRGTIQSGLEMLHFQLNSLAEPSPHPYQGMSQRPSPVHPSKCRDGARPHPQTRNLPTQTL